MDTNPVAPQPEHTPSPSAPADLPPLPPRGEKRRRSKMDIDRRALLAGAGLLGAAAFVRSAKAGDLSPPPGPIAPTGKSLRDVEPRTPVSVQSLPGNNDYMCIIQQRGSYMLTGDLLVSSGKGGILVAVPSGCVTIHMCGFSIRGIGQGTRGGIVVESAGLSCLEVDDGFIRDLGGTAVDSGGARVLDCYDLHIDNCAQGIVCRSTGLVEACHVERCLGHGCAWFKSASPVTCCFYCDDCEFRACGGHGVCMIGDWSQGDASFCVCDTDCVQCGQDGIHLTCISSSAGTPTASCTGDIVDCRCVGNGGHGNRLSTNSPSSRCVVSVMDCMCDSNTLGGMRCASMCVDVVDCTCCDNGFHGISLDTCFSSSCECCMTCRNAGAGVQLSHVTRCSVCDCSSHSNAAQGVCVDGQCAAVAVTECDCSGNLEGISCQGGTRHTFLWNTCADNGTNYLAAPGVPMVVVSTADLATNTCPHANYAAV